MKTVNKPNIEYQGKRFFDLRSSQKKRLTTRAPPLRTIMNKVDAPGQKDPSRLLGCTLIHGDLASQQSSDSKSNLRGALSIQRLERQSWHIAHGIGLKR